MNNKVRKQEEDQELNELLTQYEEEKKAFKKRMSERVRFTANEIFNIKNAIEGIRMSPNGEIQKISGIGDLKGEDYAVFNSKLGRNLQTIKNELNVITGICPKLDDNEAEDYEKYQNELSLLEARNINSKNITGSHKKLPTIEKIRLSGNLEIYEGEKEKLDNKHKKILKRVKEITDISNRIFDQPICKCDFDMILESEIPPEVSPNERQSIYPMVKNDVTEEEPEQPKKN